MVASLVLYYANIANVVENGYLELFCIRLSLSIPPVSLIFRKSNLDKCCALIMQRVRLRLKICAISKY